jgi:hypothetical protein
MTVRRVVGSIEEGGVPLEAFVAAIEANELGRPMIGAFVQSPFGVSPPMFEIANATHALRHIRIEGKLVTADVTTLTTVLGKALESCINSVEFRPRAFIDASACGVRIAGFDAHIK